MSNKRITDLTELTNPTTDDVFPVVDIASNTTTKVQLGNLPIPTAVTTALATKQDTLVSGTNIKTVNSTSLLGSGNVAVQETLVSGTNIKTLNSTSLLGSGNIVLTANPSGVSGAIQFSNGSAFASDASNLFWDDTNNRLGVGTNAPSATAHFKGSGSTSATTSLLVQNNSAANLFRIRDDNAYLLGNSSVRPLFGPVTGITSFSPNGTALQFSIDNVSRTTIGFDFLFTYGARDYTSGSCDVHRESASFSPTSGTGVFNQFVVNGTINQTGGANGITRGIYVNNTITSASDFRAIETSAGGAYINTISVAASAILQADSTTKGFLPPRMTTTQKNAIASPSSGLVVYDSTTNKLCCYNGSTWNDLF